MGLTTRRGVRAILRDFAEAHLNASSYPDCSHRFHMYGCTGCGERAFALTIERHPGDRKGDFHGVVSGQCVACRKEVCLLSITSGDAASRPEASERPTCECGGTAFYVGSCERWEDWGFFDEGTLVAMCQLCARPRVLLDTD